MQGLTTERGILFSNALVTAYTLHPLDVLVVEVVEWCFLVV